MTDSEMTPEEWNARYAHGRPGWDLDRPPAILIDVISRYAEQHKKVFVPCAGLGTDAIAWAQAGHDTVAVDFAPLAVEGAQREAKIVGVDLTILQANLFNLPKELNDSFEIVWEQTCLAALKPRLRDAYFKAMAGVLRSGGMFIGLLWNHGRSGGPPYSISLKLIKEIASPYFSVADVEWVNPSTTTRNPEFLVHLKKQGR